MPCVRRHELQTIGRNGAALIPDVAEAVADEARPYLQSARLTIS